MKSLIRTLFVGLTDFWRTCLFQRRKLMPCWTRLTMTFMPHAQEQPVICGTHCGYHLNKIFEASPHYPCTETSLIL